MQTRFHKIGPLAYCSLLSILVHLILISSTRMLGGYDFSAPVNQPLAVMVDLTATATAAVPESPKVPAPEPAVAEAPARTREFPEQKIAGSSRPADPEPARIEPAAEPEPTPARTAKGEERGAAEPTGKATLAPPREPRQILPANTTPPTMLKTLSAMLASKQEKLTYLISMHGIPIGTAELESKNEKGVTAITLRVKSNSAISSFFPVDNVIETRHIDGMFIMTKIRQQEGSFRSDQAFTINLGKKKVSWVDLSAPRTLTMAVPTDDVLDSLSGIYYLRNRQLEVGKTEILHIFDSETYAHVPVEILRREEMRLPNLTRVATLVVRPVQKTAGMFRRTGDVMIWLTDDDFKVPVKIVTSVAIGQVTAELVSAESKPQDEDGKDPQPLPSAPPDR